jgi:hypothetical protein
MSAPEYTSADRWSTTDVVGGFLATASIFVSALGLIYRPARLLPVAVVLALIAARMTPRNGRLVAVAIAAAVICWTIGMTIAVVTENPIY